MSAGNSIFALHPLDAALLPAVTARVQACSAAWPGMLHMRALVRSTEKGSWYISVDTATVIADCLEGKGRHDEAAQFRRETDRAKSVAAALSQAGGSP